MLQGLHTVYEVGTGTPVHMHSVDAAEAVASGVYSTSDPHTGAGAPVLSTLPGDTPVLSTHELAKTTTTAEQLASPSRRKG